MTTIQTINSHKVEIIPTEEDLRLQVFIDGKRVGPLFLFEDNALAFADAHLRGDV